MTIGAFPDERALRKLAAVGGQRRSLGARWRDIFCYRSRVVGCSVSLVRPLARRLHLGRGGGRDGTFDRRDGVLRSGLKEAVLDEEAGHDAHDKALDPGGILRQVNGE